jgi:hypothetical protein
MSKGYLLGFLMLGVLSGVPSLFSQTISPGTVLPVLLETTLDTRHDRPGKKVTAKLMQDVPLTGGTTVPKGAHVIGHVASITAGGPNLPWRLAITFDQLAIGKKQVSVTTHLRALASMNEVFEARLPTNAIDDYGTSNSDWNTVQVGGAGVYRGSGQVVDGDRIVGHSTDFGAVTARLISAPQRGCNGSDEREQAFWLFSPWACGVYGYPEVKVAHRGDTAPTGEIAFESNRDIRINAGSGLLLRLDSSSQ